MKPICYAFSVLFVLAGILELVIASKTGDSYSVGSLYLLMAGALFVVGRISPNSVGEANREVLLPQEPSSSPPFAIKKDIVVADRSGAELKVKLVDAHIIERIDTITENQIVKPESTMEKNEETPKETPKKVESYWAKSDREMAEKKQREKEQREALDKQAVDILSPTVLEEETPPPVPPTPLFSVGDKRVATEPAKPHESTTRFNKNIARVENTQVTETPPVINAEVGPNTPEGKATDFVIDYNRNDAPNVYRPMYMDMLSFGLNGGPKVAHSIEKMFLKYGHAHEIKRIKVGNRNGIAFVIKSGQYPNFRIPVKGFIEVK